MGVQQLSLSRHQESQKGDQISLFEIDIYKPEPVSFLTCLALMAYISNRLTGTVLYVSSLMLVKMILSKQMKTLTSMSRIEELPRVEKHLGEEGSPGLLDHYGLPLLLLGLDDHHHQQPSDCRELQGGSAHLHQGLIQHCLWFFV